MSQEDVDFYIVNEQFQICSDNQMCLF